MLPLVFLSQPAKAIEPVSIIATLAGAVLSPVICKEIKCKEDNYIIIDRSKDKKRLLEMRDTFEWDKTEKSIDNDKKVDYNK